MIDYEKEFGRPDYAIGAKATTVATTFKYVYGWMGVGLALSGLVAWYTASSGLTIRLAQGHAFMILALVEIGLVIALSAAINKISAGVALLMFLGYAALNGLTLSVIFYAFELATIAKVFFITAGMFGGLAIWGTVTKNDLSSIGSIAYMGLWGIIIASLVNIFFRSSGLDWAITFIGILVFTGLTMFDAQKIKQLASAEGTLDTQSLKKVGVLGALTLYLDFINLFLYILRFMGNRRK